MADFIRGSDAAWIKPKLIPDDELLPRDNSGGIDFDPHTAQFGDAGYVTGAKAHLSASGGGDTESVMQERAQGERGYRKPARPKAED